MGFEPTDAFTSPVFKTGAFDHSAISPCVKVHSTQTQDLFYHRGLCLSTINKERKDVFSRKNGLTFVGGGGIINKLIPFRECKSEYPGVAKFGIALEWGSRGLEFESQHSDHIGASFIWLAPFFYKSRNTLMPLCLRSQSKPLRRVRVAFRCETGNNGIYTAAMLQTRRKGGDENSRPCAFRYDTI